MTSIFGRKAATIALLLALSTIGAAAQTVSDDPRTTPGQMVVQKSSRTEIPSEPKGAASAEPTATGSVVRDSLAKDAIRVPAFGTAAPTTLTLAQNTSPQPRKRPRVAVQRMQTVDLPPPYVTRPLTYRFGYGYGPGIRLYRW